MTAHPRRRRADLDAALHRWFVLMLLTNSGAALTLVVGCALYVAGEPAGLWLLAGGVGLLGLGSLPVTIRWSGLSNHVDGLNARRLRDGRYGS